MIVILEEESIMTPAESANDSASRVIRLELRSALVTYQNRDQKRGGNLRLRGIRPKITSGMLEYKPANKKPA